MKAREVGMLIQYILLLNPREHKYTQNRVQKQEQKQKTSNIRKLLNSPNKSIEKDS